MEAINTLIGTTIAKVAALKKIAFLSARFARVPEHVRELKRQLLCRASNMIVLLVLTVSLMS